MICYPKWVCIEQEDGSKASSRWHIEGLIYIGDRSADNLISLNPERFPSEVTPSFGSDWQGSSGAAVICDGLIVAVQTCHQHPRQPKSLGAEPLWTVYSDNQWCALLEKHGIDPNPEIVHCTKTKALLEYRERSDQLICESYRRIPEHKIDAECRQQLDGLMDSLNKTYKLRLSRKDVEPIEQEILYREDIKGYIYQSYEKTGEIDDECRKKIINDEYARQRDVSSESSEHIQSQILRSCSEESSSLLRVINEIINEITRIVDHKKV